MSGVVWYETLCIKQSPRIRCETIVSAVVPLKRKLLNKMLARMSHYLVALVFILAFNVLLTVLLYSVCCLIF